MSYLRKFGGESGLRPASASSRGMHRSIAGRVRILPDALLAFYFLSIAVKPEQSGLEPETGSYRLSSAIELHTQASPL